MKRGQFANNAIEVGNIECPSVGVHGNNQNLTKTDADVTLNQVVNNTLSVVSMKTLDLSLSLIEVFRERPSTRTKESPFLLNRKRFEA